MSRVTLDEKINKKILEISAAERTLAEASNRLRKLKRELSDLKKEKDKTEQKEIINLLLQNGVTSVLKCRELIKKGCEYDELLSDEESKS